MIKINEYSKKKKSVYDTNYARIVAYESTLHNKIIQRFYFSLIIIFSNRGGINDRIIPTFTNYSSFMILNRLRWTAITYISYICGGVKH
jgi:hypothetical protein